MSATSAPVVPPQPAPVPAAPPATEFDRLLAALPESFRQECHSKLDDSNLDANHPVFSALAELYEKEQKKPARNFIDEVTAHADQAEQLLQNLRKIPEVILAGVEPQLLGLSSALNGPLQRLENASTSLQRNVEALPVLLLAQRPQQEKETKKEKASEPMPEKGWSKFWWRVGQFFRTAHSTVSEPMAWIVTGTICLTFSFTIAVTILFIGAAHLSQSYEQAYQDRVAHMEADSTANTIALNQLLNAKINLMVERSKDDNTAYFLILQGAQKAAQPVNSPEGLAVEVWP